MNEGYREDKKAFPYQPVNAELREKYAFLKTLDSPIPVRFSKILFDKIFSAILIICAMPLFLAIAIAYFIDGLVHEEHKGPLFSPYVARSCNNVFKKYKFRLVKQGLVKHRSDGYLDYRDYPSERKPENLTCVGKFLKKHYLDELPQIYNIFRGDISFVGPRPLAEHHYLMDISQGNLSRKYLKGGLFSETHTRKGTPDFGNPELEYQYMEKYLNYPALQLLALDIKIMLRGIKMIIEGKGF